MVGHLTGRVLLQRDGYEVDFDAIVEGAKQYHVVLEFNANPHRRDLDWRRLKQVQDAGVMISVNPDAHSTLGLACSFTSLPIARKGWLRRESVLNALDLPGVMAFFEAQRALKIAQCVAS